MVFLFWLWWSGDTFIKDEGLFEIVLLILLVIIYIVIVVFMGLEEIFSRFMFKGFSFEELFLLGLILGFVYVLLLFFIFFRMGW